jgi:hypothetical protein
MIPRQLIPGQSSDPFLYRLIPGQNSDWLLYLTIASIFVGLVQAYTPSAPGLHGRMHALLLVGTIFALLAGQVRGEWSVPLSVAWVLGLTAVGILVWAALDELTTTTSGPAIPLFLLILAVGSSLVASISGNIKVGQFVAGVAAPLGACFLISCWRPSMSLLRGILPTTMVVLAGAGLMGTFYSEVPLVCAIILALTPMGAWLLGRGPARRLGPWKAMFFYGAAGLIPVAVAVALALRMAVTPEMDEYPGF